MSHRVNVSYNENVTHASYNPFEILKQDFPLKIHPTRKHPLFTGRS